MSLPDFGRQRRAPEPCRTLIAALPKAWRDRYPDLRLQDRAEQGQCAIAIEADGVVAASMPPGGLSGEEVSRHAPIVCRAEDAVRERNGGDGADVAGSGAEVQESLMSQVPGAVKRVPDDEERGKPEAQQPETGEECHAIDLEPERRVVAEILDEGQVHGGDRNEQQ